MSSEWIPMTLGELCEKQGGRIQTGPFGSQLHNSDYVEKGVPVVMPTNIIDSKISEAGIARVGSHDVERLAQHKLNVGDIVFSRRGDVTKNALIRSSQVGWLCGTGCLKVRLGNESIASARFVSYYLRHPDTIEWLVRHAVGATMPNLNTDILSRVPVSIPSINTQKKIVAILDALSNTIETLQHQNTALEAIAQRLFRSWFVKFDPVHAKAAGQEPAAMSAELAALFPSEFEESALGLIPEGWSVESLDASITYLNGLALQKYPAIAGEATLPVLKIAQLRAGRTDASILANRKMRPEFVVRDGDIVFSWSGSLEVKIWTGGEAALNQHLFKVFSNVHPAWFSYQSTLKHLPLFREIAASKATTMGHIQRHHLTEAKVAVAPKDLIKKCLGVFGPMHSLIITNGKLIREFEELRDHLLPRLISGKLSLSDAEAALAAVKPEVELAQGHSPA